MCCYVMSNDLTFSTVLGFINGFLFEDYADLLDFLISSGHLSPTYRQLVSRTDDNNDSNSFTWREN